MKKRWILLSLVLAMLLCLFQNPARAEQWPSSREELASANVPSERGRWFNEGEYQEPAEKWAKLWVQKNYGKDVEILSMQCIGDSFFRVYVGKLLDGYDQLRAETWEIRLIPQTVSDDFERSDGSITVSTQIVYLRKEYNDFFSPMQYTLAGFLSPDDTFYDLHEVRAYLYEDPRFVGSLKELRTVVPEGVTEIDLRTILGDDALDIRDAWMLSADICMVNRSLREGGNYEIILLDIKNRSIFSRTAVPYEEDQYQYLSGSDRENGVHYLGFTSREDPQEGSQDDDAPLGADFSTYFHINISVLPDGTVDIGDVTPSNLMVMPGGKTAIREADDGSLYAVDQATNEEELLIQGVSLKGGDPSKYEPCWDELPYDGWEEEFDYYPLTKDTDFYPYDADDLYFSIREFYVVKPLDEHRFIYAVSSWEWNSGYGIYDLQTRMNHRITGRGDFFGIRGDMLFGQNLKTDANTYESLPLPEAVRKQLKEAAEWMTNDLVYCDISPNGALLATSDMKARFRDKNLWQVSMEGKEPVYREASTVSVTDR